MRSLGFGKEKRIWCLKWTETGSVGPEHTEEGKESPRLGWRQSQGLRHLGLDEEFLFYSKCKKPLKVLSRGVI